MTEFPIDADFLLDPFEPAYLRLTRKELDRRVQTGLRQLDDCCACPRHCHVNRTTDESGGCGTGRHARVSSAFAHLGEEDCLRGWSGSGTIFFSGCNLRCVFCQNWDISQKQDGKELPAQSIANIMLSLQNKGCHNINLVTPEHVVPQVLEAIAVAIAAGLHLPIVYNTSAYDSLDSLQLLDGIVDIYMPDFKFWHSETAQRLAGAQDYPERARAAIREMHRQVGPLKFGPNGTARRGLLVRQLVLPGQSDQSAEIFRWLAEQISPDTYVNIMDQYRPAYEVGVLGVLGTELYSEINRRPTGNEIAAARQAACAAGLWRFDKP